MPRRPLLPGRAIRLIGGLCLAGMLLGGCVMRPRAGIPASPNARLYAYFIAHGMARGALMTGAVPPGDVFRLVALDRAARDAVLNAFRQNSPVGNKAADAALAALLDGTVPAVPAAAKAASVTPSR